MNILSPTTKFQTVNFGHDDSFIDIKKVVSHRSSGYKMFYVWCS